MSRATTFYASAYDTERMHEVRMRHGTVRQITVDLNGLLPAGVSISAVAWDTSGQGEVSLSDADFSARAFSSKFAGVCAGNGEIEARASLSDGSVSVQRIAVWVQ